MSDDPQHRPRLSEPEKLMIWSRVRAGATHAQIVAALPRRRDLKTVKYWAWAFRHALREPWPSTLRYGHTPDSLRAVREFMQRHAEARDQSANLSIGLRTGATPSVHQLWLAGVLRDIADGLGGPEFPHLAAMQSLDVWRTATADWWTDHGGRPALVWTARAIPAETDVELVRAHSENWAGWSAYESLLSRDDKVGALLWDLLEEVVASAETESGLPLLRPASWRYADLDVRLNAAGLGSGFFGSMLYMATKRHLMLLGVAGFWEHPGEQHGPLVGYHWQVTDQHVWANIPLWPDTPIAERGRQHPAMRAILGEFTRRPGFRMHPVPIARCPEEQADGVIHVHKRALLALRQDARVRRLCEEWLEAERAREQVIDLFRSVEPATLHDPGCVACT